MAKKAEPAVLKAVQRGDLEALRRAFDEGLDPEVSVGGSSIVHRGADSQSIPNPRSFSFGAHFTL